MAFHREWRRTDSVHLLGAHLDETMRFETHSCKIVRACFFLKLRQLKGIRDCLSLDAVKTLLNAFVVSRLDYSNGLLVDLPDKQPS